MIRVLTASNAVSLQSVATDIVKVGQKLRLDIGLFDKIVPAYEIRKSGGSAIIVMCADPHTAVPWLLLARDLTKGGVKNVFYAAVEGKLNKKFVSDWMKQVSFVAISNYVREKLIESGLRVVDVVHHGIDMSVVEQARKSRRLALEYFSKHGLDPANHVITLTISNSLPRKGLAWYNKVIEEVVRKDNTVKFLIITNEKGTNHFSKHDNIVVTTDFGRLPKVTVLSLIAHTHIFVLPSLAEGFGLPVLEAMAAGTPAIHTELPPLMEFSTGFTVPVKEIYYYCSIDAGTVGIVYEHHLYDVAEFADVILQVVDLVRNKKEQLEDWRVKSISKVKEMDIHNQYPKLLNYVM